MGESDSSSWAVLDNEDVKISKKRVPHNGCDVSVDLLTSANEDSNPRCSE